MIDKFVKHTTKEISIDRIQKVICEYFDIHIDNLNSKTRKREIVQARQLAMFFSKKHTKSSLTNLIETNKDFRVSAQEIEKKIKI